jgi:hypothetical protein
MRITQSWSPALDATFRTPALSNGVIIVRGLKDVFAIGARR